MADMNSFAFTGRLTKDAEFKTLASGKSLLVASVANNTGYGDFKKTLYLKVQQWGDKGANVAPYLKKGTTVAVVGSLELNTWNTKEGEEKVDLTVNTGAIQIITSGSKYKADPDPTDPEYNEVNF